MRKLSDYKNEDALDLLADILEPVAHIFADKEFVEQMQVNKMSAIQHVIRNHKRDVLTIMARLEGVSVEEYQCTIFTLPMALLEMMNDPDLIDFFKSQGLKINGESFGSAMANIEGEHFTDSTDM